MKKTLITTAVVATLLGASASAFAASGFYLSGGAGMGFLKLPSKITPGVVSPTSTSSDTRNYNFAGRLATGYLFTINPTFDLGAELGYDHIANTKTNGSASNLGSTQTLNYAFNQNIIDLMGVAKINLSQKWSVNAKAGAAYVMQNASRTQTQAVFSKVTEKAHKVLPEVALGVAYNLNQHVSLGVEGSYIFGKKVNASQLNNLNVTTAAIKNNLSKVASSATVMATVTYTF